jgi:hypothetical protein
VDGGEVASTAAQVGIDYESEVQVASLVAAICPEPRDELSLLEIGRPHGGLRARLPDRLRSGCLPVLGGDRPLPYPDDAFDVVFCDEVLADVAPERREGFLREMLRTARDRIVLTVPSPAAVRAGAALLELLGEHPGLTKRAPESVPTPEEITALLDGLGARCTVTPCHHLGSWILATVFAHLDLPAAVARQVSELLRQYAAPHESVEPCRCYVVTAAEAQRRADHDHETLPPPRRAQGPDSHRVELPTG